MLGLILAPRRLPPLALRLSYPYRRILFSRLVSRLEPRLFFTLTLFLRLTSRPIILLSSRLKLSSPLQPPFKLQQSFISQLSCQHRLPFRPRGSSRVRRRLVFRKPRQLLFRSKCISKRCTPQAPQPPSYSHKICQSPAQDLRSARSLMRYNSKPQQFQQPMCPGKQPRRG